MALPGCSNEPPAPTPPVAQAKAKQAPAAPSATAPSKYAMVEEDAAYEFSTARKKGLPANGLLLVADTFGQTATLISSNGIQREYKMSSSKFGNGNKANSNKTPLGWHKVTERFGETAAPGTHFVSRKATGKVLPPSEWRNEIDGDYVLTRIMWLTGLEPGVNVGSPDIDSHDRCIYIHGTNQEQLLGQPGSHGCLRLSNKDVIELFNLAKGIEVYCRII